MANEFNNKAPFKVIATTSSRIDGLAIENGQLIFIQDKSEIAFDFKDKRVLYKQINTLETENDRTSIVSPSCGYYFVIETAVMWFYSSSWLKITREPDEVIFVGNDIDLPSLGQTNKLYVSKNKKEISVWDNDTNEYIAVSNYTGDITNEDIDNLFA